MEKAQTFQTLMRSLISLMQYYDIRKKCEGDLCYDFSNMERFLNEKSVREALGVGDIDFVSCSSTVYEAMLMDWMRNFEVGIPTLLEDGIRVLIYAGEYDLICNWLGEPRSLDLVKPLGSLIFIFCLNNRSVLLISQEILSGFMLWNGLAKKILEQLPLFPLKLMVLKQGK